MEQLPLVGLLTTVLKVVLAPASPRVTPLLEWNILTSVVCWLSINVKLVPPLIGPLSSSDCADSIGATGVPAVASTCDMPCSGNASEICGGPVRLNIYNYTGSASPGSGTGTGTGTGTSNGNGTTVTNLGGQVTDLPAPWEYNACWVYVPYLSQARRILKREISQGRC